ncbi:amidohydrolase family protein [Agromyces archimandritae]|uniref:Amidohydrolase n=1 Tax=Agromyces archimandritae TaxID=2781962 RepID=A0A975FRP8_9MICO|nr:amidohydrolase family protein [Agromyces archimandritae]QTX06001.1 amidohydrolase [Agromyces archimandritae]
MRIDLHSHFYPKEFFDIIEEADSDFSFGVGTDGMRFIAYQGARFFGLTEPMSRMDLRLEAMDRAGVDVAVMSVGPLPQFIKDRDQQIRAAKFLNDRYAELIAENPDRLGAYATVPMADPKAALAEVDRMVDGAGFNGVILPSNIAGDYYDDPRFEPFLSEANDRGLTLFMHPLLAPANNTLRDFVMGPILGFMFDTTISVARLAYSGTLDRYPNITWHIGHAGGAVAWLMERIDNGYRDYAEDRKHIDHLPSESIKRLYFDTVTFNPHNLRFLRDIVGTDHMVLGTDFPHPLGGIEKGVASIEAMEVPRHEKEQIFSGTALSILNNAERLGQAQLVAAV